VGEVPYSTFSKAVTYFLDYAFIDCSPPPPKKWRRKMVTVTVDPAKCNGDSVCIQVCPVSVFESKEVPGFEGTKSVVVNNDACIVCRACEIQCATQAIAIAE
jgi:NAD-dependent dihydropyrimidine dehydrogenase PreA subunit